MSDLPNNRKSAIAMGSKKYYTGEQCKAGHLSARYTQSGSCQACILKSSRDAACNFAPVEQREPGELTPSALAMQQTIDVPVRCRVEKVVEIRKLAGELLACRYPGINPNQAWSGRAGTKGSGGTLLYSFKLHPDDVDFVRATAGAMLHDPTLNVAAERARLYGRAAAFEEEVDSEPAFRP